MKFRDLLHIMRVLKKAGYNKLMRETFHSGIYYYRTKWG